MRAVATFALFSLGILPLAVMARAGGQKVSLAPAVVDIKNSQTMELLTAHRNFNPTITPGAQLAIVDDTALLSEDITTAFADQGAKGTGEISVYTVRDGDTLGSISQLFGVSVNTIKWANNLSGPIHTGEELVILPVTGVRHVVKKGDTVQSVAKLYSAAAEDIIAYNGLSADGALVVGSEIIIPGGELTGSQGAGSTPKVRHTGTSGYAWSSDAEPFEPLLVNVSHYPSYPGYFARPLASAVVTQGLHGYNAVDLGAAYGSSIMAAAEGRVIIARSGGYNGGYGSYVVISHPNGTQTLYGHMSRVTVTADQKVVQGQIIGAVGSTGKSTGAHLHFEVRGAKNPFGN